MPFEPIDLIQEEQHDSAVQLASTPPGRWLPVISSSCTFSGHVFDEVMLNLVRNPNFNTSWVFRADILFASGVEVQDEDAGRPHDAPAETKSHDSINGYQDVDSHGVDVGDHCRPRRMQIEGFKIVRTLVRKMISRNPQRDQALLQTCLFYVDDGTTSDGGTAKDSLATRRVVVYVPHVARPEEIPYYHPKVEAIAFMHTQSYISIHYALFNSAAEVDTRQRRTALQLLQTLHKHGHGTAAGYIKRVHHDVLMPQARYQDTYTRLKAVHAKRLLDSWVETTDPGKHVFEDLGIAAFLIERWHDMYGQIKQTERGLANGTGAGVDHRYPCQGTAPKPAPFFPGFVDIGCGNGVLVEILNREGWNGWGFDARRRKTWATLSVDAVGKLKELILLPAPLVSSDIEKRNVDEPPGEEVETGASRPVPFHHGLFPPGTFLVSNHADQLTGWTPILAALADYAPFIIIPCCSCDLSGARFRAPAPSHTPPHSTAQARSAARHAPNGVSKDTPGTVTSDRTESACTRPPAAPAAPAPASFFSPEPPSRTQAESGVISKPVSQSTYAGLVAWTVRIAERLGYVVEREVLRIPSTRNIALLGRHPRQGMTTTTTTTTTTTGRASASVGAAVSVEAGPDGGTVGVAERNGEGDNPGIAVTGKGNHASSVVSDDNDDLSRTIDDILSSLGIGPGGSTALDLAAANTAAANTPAAAASAAASASASVSASGGGGRGSSDGIPNVTTSAAPAPSTTEFSTGITSCETVSSLRGTPSTGTATPDTTNTTATTSNTPVTPPTTAPTSPPTTVPTTTPTTATEIIRQTIAASWLQRALALRANAGDKHSGGGH